MIRYTVLLPLLFAICGFFENLQASDYSENPFIVKSYGIKMIDSATHRARITIAIEVKEAGHVSVNIQLVGTNIYTGERVRYISGDTQSTKFMSAGQQWVQSLEVYVPSYGYMRVADAYLTYSSANPNNGRYITNDVVNLFGEINGIDIKYRNTPDPAHCRPPILVAESENKLSTSVQSASVTGTISISGKIRAFDLNNFRLLGVPNVEVMFDWDHDGKATTQNNPLYSSGSSTVTDATGYYSFTREFILPSNSSFWDVNNIRVYARMSNDAAYNEEYDVDATFGQSALTDISALSPSSPNAAPVTVNLTVDQFNGAALRTLWRAREFFINDLRFHSASVPNAIRYDLETIPLKVYNYSNLSLLSNRYVET